MQGEVGEDQARPALGEIKQDVLKPIRGMSLGAWSGWQDQKRGQGLRRHKQSEWRAGGGLGEQGRGVVGGGGGRARGSTEASRVRRAVQLRVAWPLHHRSRPRVFETGLKGSSSSAGIWCFGNRVQMPLVAMLSLF